MVGRLGIFLKSSTKINILILELQLSRTSADTYNMTQISNFTYFKVTFIIVTVGITGGLITKGLFDIDFKDLQALGSLLLKSGITGALIGALLGLLNILFRVGPFPKKEVKNV